MKLSFYGAAHEVTGSCFMLESSGKRMLIDCGMQQGPDEFNNQTLPFKASEIDSVFLTHAHIDHSGRLPLLSKMGFKGNVYSTLATGELCKIMLKDSAHIQEFEAEWRNRKKKRAGEEACEPLYSMVDAENIINRFVTFGYNEMIDVCEGVKLRFVDAGHLLGSASLEIWLSEGNLEKKIVFSGDIGNLNQPLINDPTYIKEADYVVMESTYGDRNQAVVSGYSKRLAQIIQDTFKSGGNVVIPSFAVGRTQEILYFLRDIKQNNYINGYDGFTVYVDSPLAIEATNIFNKTVDGYFDAEATELINNGINPIGFPGLRLSLTSDDSKAINFDKSKKVIISASGMCEAGRIRHHLKHNLWRQESTILFVGYQAVSTLGRAILEGVKNVKLFGESIAVKAKIVQFEGISAHADLNGLIKWVKSYEKIPSRIFVVHGETNVSKSFANLLNENYKQNAIAPYFGACFDLSTNEFLEHGTAPKLRSAEISKVDQKSKAHEKLLNAGERLRIVIEQNLSSSYKDIIKLADQINNLSNRWKR